MNLVVSCGSLGLRFAYFPNRPPVIVEIHCDSPFKTLMAVGAQLVEVNGLPVYSSDGISWQRKGHFESDKMIFKVPLAACDGWM